MQNSFNVDEAATRFRLDHPELSTYECYRLAQGNAMIEVLEEIAANVDVAGDQVGDRIHELKIELRDKYFGND